MSDSTAFPPFLDDPGLRTDTLRVPPHSIQAEQSLLGGLMLDNSTWDSIADRLSAEDFYRRDHQQIFSAVAELSARSEPADAVTLAWPDDHLVFTTDGRIKAFDFRVLKDDKAFFPDYAIVPVVRTETLKANPGLEKPLNDLASKITDSVMQRLNAAVDVDKKSVEDVAKEFLNDEGLV